MGRKLSVKESDVERALIDAVTERGGICAKVTVLGQRGFFDRLIVLPGNRVIFCEVKKPHGGRVSPHQRKYHALLRALDAEVVLVRKMDDIARLLKTARAGVRDPGSQL